MAASPAGPVGPANQAARILAGAVRAIPGASSAGAPGLAKDSTNLSTPSPVRVITFNTAVGNSKIKTPQGQFVNLPFYQEIVNGSPNAPILCAQEVGPDQLNKLKELSKNGNFKVIATYAHPGQANMILVPKRFEVVKSDHTTFTGQHVKGFVNALVGWFKGKGTPHWSQMFEPRKYTEVLLRDKESGRQFTLYNTHISYYGPLKVEQAEQLLKAANKAAANGPVVLAGDLNTRAADNEALDAWDSNLRVRQMFGGLEDMGGPSADVKPKSNIDWVLASGFESVSSKIYKGGDLTLPGFPSAELVSDHYAEEDTLRFQ